MPKATAGQAKGHKQTRFINPWPFELPGQRRSEEEMSKKKPKNGNKKKPRHKNSAGSTGGAAPRAAARPINPAKPKKKPRHKNSGRFRLSLGGLGLLDLLAVGGGALVTQILTNVLPLGAPGSWLSIVEGFGIAWGVHYVAPASVKKSATAGAVAAPVVALANKLVPNLTQRLVSLIPTFPSAQPAAGANGLIVVPDQNARYFPDGQPGMNGIITVTQDSPLMPFVG